MAVEIELSQPQSDAWHYLEDDTTNEVFYGGGAGGGKSWLGCVWHIARRKRYPGSRGFIGRNGLKELGDSTIVTFFSVLQLLGYRSGKDYKYNSQKNIITWSNGSQSVFRHLQYEQSDPDFQRLGSTEYTDAFIDEIGEITLKAYEIINSRLRWKLHEFGLVPKMLGTCNPGYHWVRDEVIREKDGSDKVLPPYRKYVSALLRDNPDKAFVNLYEQQLSRMSSEYDKARLLYGDWDAVEKTGGEFYNKFERSKHVVKLVYNPALPLHISFDFNVQPYMTLTIWQVSISKSGKKYAYQVDEICAVNPDNSTPGICRLFRQKYPKHVSGLFVYGDPAGKHDDTRHDKRLTKGRNDWDIIMQELDRYHPEKRVSSSAPSVVMRGQWINEVLHSNYEDIFLYFSDGCIKTIEDYIKVMQAPDGTKQKKRVTDPKTRISYEKHGHTSDANDYFLTRIFKSEYNRYITGKKAGTRGFTGKKEMKESSGSKEY